MNDLHQCALSAPCKSGVYIWRDKNRTVIYVGKAKNLKNRLSSYFSGPQTIKTMCLKKAAASIEYVTTQSDYEAFLLENTLIKKYSPRYNIALKDDKTYPVLCVTKGDAFPKVFKTRNTRDKSSLYFGPYPVVGSLDDFIHALYDVFPIRRCKRFHKRATPCLYYHMGSCLGPCCYGEKVASLYSTYIGEIIDLLKENDSDNQQSGTALIKNKMTQAANNSDFERAIKLRQLLQSYNALSIEGTQTLFETNEYITHIADTIDKTVSTNAMFFDAKTEYRKWLREAGDIDGMRELQKILSLDTLPRVIEGFDIAHIGGLLPVASLIYFFDGNPKKSEYRYFRLKTTDGKIDDFLSMREATARRYTRLLNEKKPLPNLILIDGGIGQVNAVAGVLESLSLNIPIVGLAKRDEELYTPGNSTPIKIPKSNPGLQLLQRVRDETHRFATSKNQALRTKRATENATQ